LAGTAIIVGAIYMLAAYKKMFFGVVTKEENKNLPDVNKRELLALIPLAIITVWLGVYPKPVLDPINNSVESIVQLMHDKSITNEAKSRIPNLIKDAEMSRTSAQEAH
jgi:NADH-quinone oxidoreductase subunit M